MKIVKHYHVDDILQRSVVRHNGLQYLRIARWVYASGVIMEPENSGPTPTWRAQRESEQSATSLTTEEAQELERCFVSTLVHLCVDSGAIAPAYHILLAGERLQPGDEVSKDRGKTWKLSAVKEHSNWSVDAGEFYRRPILSRSPEAAE